jgi:hypothetical protein
LPASLAVNERFKKHLSTVLLRTHRLAATQVRRAPRHGCSGGVHVADYGGAEHDSRRCEHPQGTSQLAELAAIPYRGGADVVANTGAFSTDGVIAY